MAKYLLWIVIGIIAVGIVVLIFDYAKKEARPQVMSQEQFEAYESEELNENEMMYVTMDGFFHRKGCSHITGTSERMFYSVAKERGLRACPYCINLDN